MRIILLVALVAACTCLLHSQNPPGQIRYVTVDPTGNPCNAQSIDLLTPNGTIFTCQSGVYAAISGGGGGGGGSVACTAPTVTGGGTFTMAFTSTVNCNSVVITAAGTVTIPSPPGTNASGPDFLIVKNATPTVAPFTYSGAAVIGNLPQPAGEQANAVTVIELTYDATQSGWIVVIASEPTAAGLAAGKLFASNGTTGPPIAGTSANVAATFVGTGCGTTTNVMQLNGNCTPAGGGGAYTTPFIHPLVLGLQGAFNNTAVVPQSGAMWAILLSSNVPAITIDHVLHWTQGSSSNHVAFAIYNAACTTLLASGTPVTIAGGVPASAPLSFTTASGTSYYLLMSSDSANGTDVFGETLNNSAGSYNFGASIQYFATTANTATWVAGAVTFPATCGALTNKSGDAPWLAAY